MVEQGLAWHYVKYSDSQALAGAEKAARAAQKGLWGAQGQVAPWDYRKLGKRPKRVNKGSDLLLL